MMKKIINLFTVLIVFFNIQISGQDKYVEDSTKTLPKAFEIEEVNSKAVEVKESLLNFGTIQKYKLKIQEIDSLYSLYSRKLSSESKYYKQFIRTNMSKLQIDNMINKWRGYGTKIKSYQSSVSEIIKSTRHDLEKFQFYLNVWELTKEKAISNNEPKLILITINEVIKELKKVLKELNKISHDGLNIETVISEEGFEINNKVQNLQKIINSGKLKYFYKRYPVVWNQKRDTTKKPMDTKKLNAFNQNARDIKVYYDNYSSNFTFFIFISILTFVFLFYLKKTYLKDVKKFNQPIEILVYSHMYAVWSYVVFLYALLYFENLPIIIDEFFLVLTSVSIIFLIQTLNKTKLRVLLVLTIIGFLINSSKAYIFIPVNYYRIYLTFESLFSLGVIFLFLIWHKQKQINLKDFTWLTDLAKVMIVVQIISLLANFLGYTNFTDILLKIFSQGVIITIISYGIIIIIGGISQSILSFYFHQKEISNQTYKSYLYKRVKIIVKGLAIIFWLVFILNTSELYTPLTEWLVQKLNNEMIIGDLHITSGSILSFLFIILLSYTTTNFISTVIDAGILNFLNLPRGVPSAISMVLRYIVFGLAILLSLGVLKIDLKSFSLLAGALGLGIGFGLQNIISNFVAGIILTFERPIKIGDMVEVGSLLGIVKRIGVRSSNIRTFDGAEVIIPNSNLLSNEMTNWTLTDEIKRVEILVGTAYGSDPNRVLEILIEKATEYQYTLKEPGVNALFNGFGDSSLNFRLLFWVPIDYAISSKSEVSIAVFNAFKEEDISIPFPQREVKILNDSDQDDISTNIDLSEGGIKEDSDINTKDE